MVWGALFVAWGQHLDTVPLTTKSGSGIVRSQSDIYEKSSDMSGRLTALFTKCLPHLTGQGKLNFRKFL